ncbi:MAG: exodeoxyribonuclease III [Propionibacteriaceae bacterium]|jgi:exodeoxyribonuclease-3|nr:exodeoxyribonuclease III [Propionibacteriaceae bacterium]
MRAASFNVNGIRAATRRGFPAWLEARDCDIVALQEVRCPEADLPDVFGGYRLTYHQGSLAGRNGVAVLSRQEPLAARRGFGHASDDEGRYLEVDLPGLTVASLYLPKGDVADGGDAARTRYERKMDFMAAFADYLPTARAAAARRGGDYLLMGDFNIAHQPADIKNWRANQKSSGFLPEEREWLGGVLGQGLVDVVRSLHEGESGPYSWWSWRGKAFDNDAGWRIDYQLATPDLAATATSAATDRDASYAKRISDHSPVVVDYA